MSDHSERAFTDTVRRWLYDEVGTANVFENVEFGTDRRPDFVVKGPLHTVWMIEVENTREGVIMGAAQALLYAGHDPMRVPVGTTDATFVPTVIIPAGVKDAIETKILAQRVHVIELNPDRVPDE